MRLSFDSIEEVKAFVKELKGTRGGKADKEDDAPQGQAPAPLAPPAGPGAPNQFNPGNGFAPPAAGATPQAAGPFAPGAAGPAPEVLALVARINARIDGAVASGQTVENVSTWFRGELIKAGVDANNATLDQIKGVLLAKAPVPALEGIAKLMNA